MGDYNSLIGKVVRGVTITENLAIELAGVGRTQPLKFHDRNGKQYLAHLEIDKESIVVVPEAKYLEHRCPHCGGRIRITSKGYFCENALSKTPSCKFHCNGILSHRFISAQELDAYLDGNPTILDGCFNNQGKIFSAVLTESERYGMTLTSVVGKCPSCGSDVLVSPVAYNCSGTDADGNPYHMAIWRHVKGYDITLRDLKELLDKGITSHEVVLNSRYGSLSKAYLKLSDDKTHVEPVFVD